MDIQSLIEKWKPTIDKDEISDDYIRGFQTAQNMFILDLQELQKQLQQENNTVEISNQKSCGVCERYATIRQCPNCGYEMYHQSYCPECGKKIKRID